MHFVLDHLYYELVYVFLVFASLVSVFLRDGITLDG